MQTHIPVLREAVLSQLAPRAGETVLDCTLGLGGHAMMFLKAVGPTGHLIGLDADPENLAVAKERLAAQNATLLHANFRDLATLALPPLDILFADLGLSSPHIDDPERGFSFRTDGPLDLRYDRERGLSAAALIKRSTESELVQIFSTYGELPRSKTLGSALYAAARHRGEPLTTGDLRSIVEKVYRFEAQEALPRVFQALRIAVNDELGALRTLLAVGPMLLRSGGRMGVIAYHSLEDRLVKDAFRALASAQKDPTTGADIGVPPFALLTRKPIVPSDEEVRGNPRSRSAKCRAIRRTMSW